MGDLKTFLINILKFKWEIQSFALRIIFLIIKYLFISF